MTASRTLPLLTAVAISAAIGLSPASRPMAQQAPAIKEAPVIGWLEILPQTQAGDTDVYLMITGRAFSPLSSRGRFTLEVNRRGAGGVSNTRQGGIFASEPGKIMQLSQTAINIQAEDRIEVVLKLFSGDEEIFRTTVQSRFPQNT